MGVRACARAWVHFARQHVYRTPLRVWPTFIAFEAIWRLFRGQQNQHKTVQNEDESVSNSQSMSYTEHFKTDWKLTKKYRTRKNKFPPPGTVFEILHIRSSYLQEPGVGTDTIGPGESVFIIRQAEFEGVT